MKKFYFTLSLLLTFFTFQLQAQDLSPFTLHLSQNQQRFEIPQGKIYSEVLLCDLTENADYNYWYGGAMQTFTAESSCRSLPFTTALTADGPFNFSIEKKDLPQPAPAAKSVANLGVDNSFIPEELVQQILIGGDCYEVNNVNSIGHQNGIGYFYDGQESIGIDNGVILSTGNITNAPGPNDTSSAGTSLAGASSDNDLEDLASGNVEDATGIEFFFTPTTDLIEFEYVFASEEYCEFVNSSYNDVFGFFISGPGINGDFQFNGENIARIPGTNNNVAINSVNHLENSAYFTGNNSNCFQTSAPQTIQYDGFTSVLTATAEVIPCETYRIRLVVGDVSDALYDSAVFLKANSFNAAGGTVVEANSPFTGTSTAYEGCENGEFIFSRDADDSSDEDLLVEFFVSAAGTALPGQDYVPFPTTVTIPAGEMSVIVPVEIIDDNIAEGEETLILEVPASCTCSQSTVQMTLMDVEPMQIEPVDPTVCGTESVALTAVTQGGMGEYQYLWEDGSTQPTLIVPPLGSGSATYHVTVTDECGNETVGFSTVTAVQPPEALIGGSGDHCDEDTETLVDLFVEFTGSGPWEFSYRQNGVLQTPVITNDNPYTLSVNGLGSYTLETVSYTDGYCPGTVAGTAEIFESELPAAVISGTGDHCAEDTETLIGLTVEFTQTGPWEIIYRRDGVLQPALTVNENPYTLEVNGLGTYTLESVSFADGHCPGTVSGAAEITESELPTAVISGTGHFCEEDTETFVPLTVDFTGEGPWEFTYERDGVTQETLTASVSPYILEVNALGTYTISSVSYPDGWCEGTTDGTAEVVPSVPPTALLSGSGELCPGDSETFVYLPVELTGDGPWELTYSYNGVPQPAVTASENPYYLPVNAIGSYALESVSYAEGLCDGTPAGTALVTEAEIDLAVEVFAAECADTNTGSIRISPLEGTAPFAFAWSDTDLTGNNPTDLYAGVYAVTMTDAAGCTSETVAEVTQPERLTAAVVKTEGLCEGDTGSLTFAEVTGGTPDYLYSIDNGEIFTGNPVFERLEGAEYDVVVQDINGCEWESKVTITPPAEIELYTEPLAIIDLGDTYEIDVEANIPAWQITEIVWTNAGTLDCTDCLNPVAAPVRTTPYTVSILTERGCTETAALVVQVDRESSPVFVPNVFSPDGDGVNDLLTVFAKEAAVVSINSLVIHSRWGEVVFTDTNITPNDIMRGWDGTHRGKLVNAGVFLWYAEVEYIDGTREMLKGDVTVTH